MKTLAFFLSGPGSKTQGREARAFVPFFERSNNSAAREDTEIKVCRVMRNRPRPSDAARCRERSRSAPFSSRGPDRAPVLITVEEQIYRISQRGHHAWRRRFQVLSRKS